MKTDPLKEAVLIINSIGIGTVTRKMVRERAVELAVINGRAAHDASASDWDQAKRELTGEPEIDPNQRLNPNAGTRFRALTDTSCPFLPSTKRMTKGEALGKDSLKRVSRKPSTIKCSKPPGLLRAINASRELPTRAIGPTPKGKVWQ